MITSNPHQIQIETEYQELMNNIALSNEKIEMTNFVEIKKHISNLKPKKSSGFDTVSNLMIKKFHRVLSIAYPIVSTPGCMTIRNSNI
jgi:hypothetical protein